MMMMMNCFCGNSYFQPGKIVRGFELWAGFEPAQNLSSDFVNWNGTEHQYFKMQIFLQSVRF